MTQSLGDEANAVGVRDSVHAIAERPELSVISNDVETAITSPYTIELTDTQTPTGQLVVDLGAISVSTEADTEDNVPQPVSGSRIRQRHYDRVLPREIDEQEHQNLSDISQEAEIPLEEVVALRHAVSEILRTDRDMTTKEKLDIIRFMKATDGVGSARKLQDVSFVCMVAAFADNIYFSAAKYAGSDLTSYERLQTAGVLGLYRGIQLYDLERTGKPDSYLHTKISGRMIDVLREESMFRYRSARSTRIVSSHLPIGEDRQGEPMTIDQLASGEKSFDPETVVDTNDTLVCTAIAQIKEFYADKPKWLTKIQLTLYYFGIVDAMSDSERAEYDQLRSQCEEGVLDQETLGKYFGDVSKSRCSQIIKEVIDRLRPVIRDLDEV